MAEILAIRVMLYFEHYSKRLINSVADFSASVYFNINEKQYTSWETVFH